jgi:hypothetical protein
MGEHTSRELFVNKYLSAKALHFLLEFRQRCKYITRWQLFISENPRLQLRRFSMQYKRDKLDVQGSILGKQDQSELVFQPLPQLPPLSEALLHLNSV